MKERQVKPMQAKQKREHGQARTMASSGKAGGLASRSQPWALQQLWLPSREPWQTRALKTRATFAFKAALPLSLFLSVSLMQSRRCHLLMLGERERIRGGRDGGSSFRACLAPGLFPKVPITSKGILLFYIIK